jgi:hypothetical protein
MSYIQDDLQMIKSCIKYIDEDKIVDFLNSIKFEFDDPFVVRYMLQTSNSKFIKLCIDSYLQDDNDFDEFIYMVVDKVIEDNTISDTALTIVKNNLLKQEDSYLVYLILHSNLVTWYNDSYNPFKSGFFDGENGCLDNDSILNQDEVNVLFSIYAESENWLENNYVQMYAENKESLAANIEKTDYNVWSSGYCSIQEVIENIADKEFVKDYFDGDIPDKIDAYTLADIMIKYGIYS